MSSAGWYSGGKASIVIDGTESARNEQGLNIVVFDHETGLVIDSVCFDTSLEEHTCTRSAAGLFNQYQQYLFENDLDSEGGACR